MGKTDMKYKVIIYSGGMDSYTLLHSIVQRTKALGEPLYSVHALSFHYGQRHARELAAARAETQALGIQHTLFEMGSLMGGILRGSALTDNIAMPEGVYDGENMRQTVVPGRNTMMLSLALAYTEGLILADEQSVRVHYNGELPTDEHVSTGELFYGAHAGDHHIYPDCRPAYIDSIARTFYLATDGKVELKAPFRDIDKGGILKIGLGLGLDYKNTWTCYKGGEQACGVCGSCDERLEAFTQNEVADPVPYSSRGRWEEQQAKLLNIHS